MEREGTRVDKKYLYHKIRRLGTDWQPIVRLLGAHDPKWAGGMQNAQYEILYWRHHVKYVCLANSNMKMNKGKYSSVR